MYSKEHFNGIGPRICCTRKDKIFVSWSCILIHVLINSYLFTLIWFKSLAGRSLIPENFVSFLFLSCLNFSRIFALFQNYKRPSEVFSGKQVLIFHSWILERNTVQTGGGGDESCMCVFYYKRIEQICVLLSYYWKSSFKKVGTKEKRRGIGR